MNDAASHTLLESLLLFTWVRTHGLEAFNAGAFQRASRDLVDHPAIKDDASYNAARLTPGVLEQLFLRLLGEELKAVSVSNEAGPADGPLSPSSKKRKRLGPATQVTNLSEARQYVNRLAIAEDKLFIKYKQRFAEDLWREQEEERRLEEEIRDLERQEREGVEAQNNATVPSAGVSPVKEASRPPSTAPVNDVQRSAPRTNGKGAPPLPPAVHSPIPVSHSVAPSAHASPLRQSAALPAPQQVTTAPSGYFAPTAGQQYQSLPIMPGAGPEQIQGVPPTIPQHGQRASATPPQSDNMQRTSLPRSDTPSHASPGPQLPQQGSLKWEPPYQAPPGAQQQRSPGYAQIPQRPTHPPQSWSPQPPPPYPLPSPHHAPPQNHAPQHASYPPRPIHGAYQQGGHGVPSLQPAPQRSHSGSPAPSQRPMGVSSPLANQSRLPQSPYQHNQQVLPPPQALPPPHRMAPPPSATPPPLSPANFQQQQWQQPPAHAQLPPAGPQHGSQPTPPLPQPYQQRYPSAPRPVPPHILAPPQQNATPAARRPHPVLPHTPQTMPFRFAAQGSGTKWTNAQPTVSTPGAVIGVVDSPAFEPLSPVVQTSSLPSAKKQSRPTGIDTPAGKKATKGSRGAHPAREGARQMRTPSAMSPREDASHADADFNTEIKREDGTPRPLEDAGDTTADESLSGRRHFASPRNPRGVGKRKRQDSMATESRPRVGQPHPPPGIPNHVLWTRAFPKNPIKAKEAPGYKSIIRQPTCLKEIQKAITAGHKAATIAAAALENGDPGTSTVWLPISEDLVPPRAIINSVQLERELVHMFANAIMYNLDPNRGPGPAFQKGSGIGGKGANEAHGRVQSHDAGDAANMIGYKVDENSVVNETNSMFKTVSHLLMELRMSEAEPGNPPAPLPAGAVPTSERLARGSIAGSVTDPIPVLGPGPAQTPASGIGGSFAEDEAEESHADRDNEDTGGTAKRRRLGRG